MSVKPVKFALKYNPPTLALVYMLDSHRYIHQFGFVPEDLQEPTAAILEALYNAYPEYLGNAEPKQLKKLVDLLKKNYEPEEGSSFSANLGQKGNDLDLYSFEESGDSQECDFAAVDKDLEDSDDSELF